MRWLLLVSAVLSLPAFADSPAEKTAAKAAEKTVETAPEKTAEKMPEKPAEAPAEKGADKPKGISAETAPAVPAAANLFPAQTWQPPPPPPGPPPPPMAPPLPFQYSGQLLEGDQIVAFLNQNNRQVIVKAGDHIDKIYRVEAITPARIEFTYLPLKQKQELLTGNRP